MDANTIGLVIGGVLAALGIGTGAGRYFLPRQGNQLEPQPAGNTNPGIINPTLDVVTESECRDVRKEIIHSFSKATDEIKTVVSRQTDTINGLTQVVTKLGAAIDNVPLVIENATMKTIRSHENKFHSPKRSGQLKSVGDDND